MRAPAAPSYRERRINLLKANSQNVAFLEKEALEIGRKAVLSPEISAERASVG